MDPVTAFEEEVLRCVMFVVRQTCTNTALMQRLTSVNVVSFTADGSVQANNTEN